MSNLTLDGENPLEMFLYALRAQESKRQYPRRLKVLLDYLMNKGELTNKSLEAQAREFLIKTKENPKWTNGKLMEFILYQKNRAERGEIVYTTIRNYLKATKLFLDMNSEVPLVNWKRIIKGLPSPKNTANDRAPTLEEIRKLIEYPDRRIKPIILCMTSGTFIIRSGYLKWKQEDAISKIKSTSKDKMNLLELALAYYTLGYYDNPLRIEAYFSCLTVIIRNILDIPEKDEVRTSALKNGIKRILMENDSKFDNDKFEKAWTDCYGDERCSMVHGHGSRLIDITKTSEHEKLVNIVHFWTREVIYYFIERNQSV